MKIEIKLGHPFKIDPARNSGCFARQVVFANGQQVGHYNRANQDGQGALWIGKIQSCFYVNSCEEAIKRAEAIMSEMILGK